MEPNMVTIDAIIIRASGKSPVDQQGDIWTRKRWLILSTVGASLFMAFLKFCVSMGFGETGPVAGEI
jgi:hypothetical protein